MICKNVSGSVMCSLIKFDSLTKLLTIVDVVTEFSYFVALFICAVVVQYTSSVPDRVIAVVENLTCQGWYIVLALILYNAQRRKSTIICILWLFITYYLYLHQLFRLAFQLEAKYITIVKTALIELILKYSDDDQYKLYFVILMTLKCLEISYKMIEMVIVVASLCEMVRPKTRKVVENHYEPRNDFELHI